jgi:hypothetical protein
MTKLIAALDRAWFSVLDMVFIALMFHQLVLLQIWSSLVLLILWLAVNFAIGVYLNRRNQE